MSTCKSLASPHAVMAYFIFIVIAFFPKTLRAEFSYASESSRENIVGSSRARKFYKNDRKLRRLALGGNYDTDQNSKQYQVTARYFYRDKKFLNEVNFLHETEYNDRGSGKNKKFKIKTSDFYDFSISSKIRILDSENYGVFYNRTVYDEFSTYYYDLHSAAGFGRIFFDDQLELDLSLGYQRTKNFDNRVNLIPSIRVNFKLTDKLTFNQRGYWFVDSKSMDNDLRTSLVYRLNPTTSFEVRHTFERRVYTKDGKVPVEVNQVRNLITFGFVFDL